MIIIQVPGYLLDLSIIGSAVPGTSRGTQVKRVRKLESGIQKSKVTALRSRRATPAQRTSSTKLSPGSITLSNITIQPNNTQVGESLLVPLERTPTMPKNKSKGKKKGNDLECPDRNSGKEVRLSEIMRDVGVRSSETFNRASAQVMDVVTSSTRDVVKPNRMQSFKNGDGMNPCAPIDACFPACGSHVLTITAVTCRLNPSRGGDTESQMIGELDKIQFEQVTLLLCVLNDPKLPHSVDRI